MSAVTNHLRAWAKRDLKYWEQVALEKIATQLGLKEADLEQLVQHFLEDAGLAPVPFDRPPLDILKNVADEAEPIPWRLNRITNLRNVNALREQQEISFGPQLTLAYGSNGAGKSGYARVIGAAGFARGKRDVLPNASGAQAKDPPQAEIEIIYNNKARTLAWKAGDRCVELRGCYLFDIDSMEIHLKGSNALTYTPSGLWLLTSLSEATDVVRERVRRLIEARERPNQFNLLFDGDSEIKRQILELGPNTKVEELQKLAEITPEQEEELVSLEKEIASLKLLDIPAQTEKRRREMRSLRALTEAIEAARTGLSDSIVSQANKMTEVVNGCHLDVEQSGADQFRFEAFSQVGTDAWLEFLTATKSLADAETVARTVSYPSSGDHCLLCRQPLSQDATELIKKLWNYLKSDAQAQLEQAEAACASKISELDLINLNYFAPDSNAHRIIAEELGYFISSLDAQREAFLQRRKEMQNALKVRDPCVPSPLLDVDLTEINKLVQIRHDEIIGLEESDVGQRLQAAEQSFRQLRHRKLVCRYLPEMIAHIEDKRWAAKAQTALGTTRAITSKYNELFNKLVTEQYRQLFEKTLNRFRQNIKVTVETRGAKGETVRQIVLSSQAFQPGFSAHQILSDGEKMAVAISDFLSEVMLDPQINAIILDDPVVSMDHTWKSTLAACLAELARERQVVIFTHDLAFLYCLKENAENLKIDAVTHWIRAEQGEPGFVYLNNSPICERDYRSTAIAREYYRKAKEAAPSHQQSMLQQGFGALRTSYEALIIFDIFNEVVVRFGERVSFGRLKEVRVDPQLANEINSRMETLSTYIEGHLHSDEVASVKPSPRTLLDEIEAFESIRKRQKELRKDPPNLAITSSSPSPVAPLEVQQKSPGNDRQPSDPKGKRGAN